MTDLSTAAQGLRALCDEGLKRHGAGDLDAAAGCYQSVLAVDPGFFDALHMLGVVHLQRGEAEAAFELIGRAAAANADSAPAQINLATALLSLGRADAALAAGDSALALAPDQPQALATRGNALLALGRPAEALEAYERVLAVSPATPQARYNQANALRDLGRLDEGIAAYDAALELAPQFLEAHVNRAAALLRQGRSEAAVAGFDRALALNPQSVPALANRARALNDLMRSDDALADCATALQVDPASPEAYQNAGVALFDLRRLDEALAAFRQAHALRPSYAEAHSNEGMTLYDLARPAEAVACLDRAITADPDLPEAHMNRGIALMALGELPRGLEDYRWRWRLPKSTPPAFACPPWEGEPVAGKRVLIHAEQGFGDSLQFVRYAAMLAERGAAVTLRVEAPLVRLFRRLPGVEVVDQAGDGSRFNFHVPMLCLPRLFGTTLDTIPGHTPYLSADPDEAATWAARLAALGPGPNIGLVWAGESRSHDLAAHAIDRRRSLTLAQFAPLAGARATFVSLQKGAPAAEAAPPATSIALVDWTAELGDFAATAALVQNLDLVITVDTAVAHLAGALARPVWILSRFAGCWRWLSGREDSPWYPTARIFHQRAPGSWNDVIGQLAAALNDFAAG